MKQFLLGIVVAVLLILGRYGYKNNWNYRDILNDTSTILSGDNLITNSTITGDNTLNSEATRHLSTNQITGAEENTNNMPTSNDIEIENGKTYSSSLGFTLTLPGECSDNIISSEGRPSEYPPLHNLNLNTNDKSIQCFLPAIKNATNVLHLMIHTYPCDNTGTNVTIDGKKFEKSSRTLMQGGYLNCYTTQIHGTTMNFSFSDNHEYEHAILKSLTISSK